MFNNVYFFVVAPLSISVLFIVKVRGLDDSESSQLDVLRDYKKALSEEEFSQMLKIYTNDSLSPIEKERTVVNYFSSLPRRIKLRLPVPIPFRSLPTGAQQKIRSIYYESGIKFEEKLTRIKQLVQDVFVNKIAENLENVNDNPDSNVVEFKINVTLQLKGYYSKEELQQYLDEHELSQLNDLLNDKSQNNHEKSIEIGILLRRIFQNRQNVLDEWPTLMGMEKLSNSAKLAIAQILFGEDPTSDMRPLLEFYRHTMENKNAQSRSRRNIPQRLVKRLWTSGKELVFRDRPQIYADYEN